MPKSAKRASSSDSYDDAYESEVSADEDYIVQYAGLTLPELHSGKRARPEDEMKLEVLRHALKHGYSANVTPSFNTFKDLVSTIGVAECKGVRRKNQMRSIRIIAQMVQNIVSPSAFPGLIVERSSTTAKHYGRRTLFISEVLLLAVNSALSFGALTDPKAKTDLLEVHAQNDRKFKEVQVEDESDRANGDAHGWGWTKLVDYAMSDYILDNQDGQKTAPASSSDRAASSSTLSSSGRRRPRGVLRSTDDVYGPPEPITEADKDKMHLKYYNIWMETVRTIRREYSGTNDPSSSRYAALPDRIKWTLEFNEGDVERKTHIDYEKWYQKAKAKGVIIDDEE
ncbi:hypothetical protein AC578_4109 [Pseudocercospora eumusae]|uniref:Uncharacterized protein n=1 Tax=Pseudocercospora eumusae TaxID=321146 RepID=A0A139HF50_9PEZI|nr:hypothetical protein AC578_4109 [Pseudocercospora eumusae]